MELEFKRNKCPCLRWDLRDMQELEQTLEVKLTDGMPDIGNIIGVWGQCVLRSKQWRSKEAGVSGGILVWVLYTPAEGGPPRSVEAWLPLQHSWTLQDAQREGVIRTQWKLCSADARMLSARKMMVRATVGILSELLEPSEVELFEPVEVPQDLQLLRRSYPTMLPTEAGEKDFSLEQSFPLPGTEETGQLLSCRLFPKLTELKTVSGRVVIKGVISCHVLYTDQNSNIRNTDLELEFSQLEDLSHLPETDPQVSVMLELTNLETELQEGQLHLKAGLAAQYLVYEQKLLELVEDAYSPMRDVTCTAEALELPALLDTDIRSVQTEVRLDCEEILDTSVYTGHPTAYIRGGKAQLQLPGFLRVLIRHPDGRLETQDTKWDQPWELTVGDSVTASPVTAGQPQLQMSGTPGQYQLTMEQEVSTALHSRQGLPMLTALKTGEQRQPEPGRPSVILKRPDGATLWELAKNAGSTVAAICEANRITQEPVDDRILLIPVL